jgi:large subunit ribosomal protein L9
MQVILLERVHKLGHMGETVTVKPGYARNFLLPRKKALRANNANVAYFEAQKAKLTADNAARKVEAEKLAKQMDGLKVVILRSAGETGQLYGSVSARDVADVIAAKNFKVDRSMVTMHHPIKTLGIFDELVRIHPEVEVLVKVNIARNEEEAKVQWEKGAALLASTALAEEAAKAEAAKAALAAELAAAEAAENKVSFKEAKQAAKKARKPKAGEDAAAEDAAE